MEPKEKNPVSELFLPDLNGISECSQGWGHAHITPNMWLQNGNDNCCHDKNLCNIDEGDCDEDSDCAGFLVCVPQSCPWNSLLSGSQDDCCQLPTREFSIASNNLLESFSRLPKSEQKSEVEEKCTVRHVEARFNSSGNAFHPSVQTSSSGVHFSQRKKAMAVKIMTDFDSGSRGDRLYFQIAEVQVYVFGERGNIIQERSTCHTFKMVGIEGSRSPVWKEDEFVNDGNLQSFTYASIYPSDVDELPYILCSFDEPYSIVRVDVVPRQSKADAKYSSSLRVELWEELSGDSSTALKDRIPSASFTWPNLWMHQRKE